MKSSKSKNNFFEVGNSLELDTSLWKLVEEQNEAKKSVILPEKHLLYFQKEKRKGKIVTLIGKFYITKKDANDILAILKKHIGVGGSFKNDFIELQGECELKVKSILLEHGFGFRK